MSRAHPRLEAIYAYTARRLSCPREWLTDGRLHATPVRKPDDERFMLTRAARRPEMVCMTRLPEASILRAHPEPIPAVARLMAEAARSPNSTLEAIARSAGVEIRKDDVDPYFYLNPRSFRPFGDAEVRQLTAADAPLLAGLHQALPEGMRWFVEIDHPVVFGCFEGETLAAVASHLLFEPERIAAAGVLTHPDFRQRGHGKTVVSAITAWALARDYTVEWSTWEDNEASKRLALALGFDAFSTDCESIVS